MAADTSPGVPVTRLNPFVFSSDTSFRFALLLVAVLGSSAFLYQAMWNTVGTNSEQYRQAILESAVAITKSPRTFEAKGAAMAQYLGPLERSRALWILGGQSALIALAGLFYWSLPRWEMRRNRLVPLSPRDLPEVILYLDELHCDAGLPQPPLWLYNPLASAPDAHSFGRSGRYYVVLTGGLVMKFYTDRPTFRAYVLHELAHIRNRDVSKAYFTVALWWAFVVAALLPYAALSVFEPLDYLLSIGWRVLVLTGLVYLTRNSVLRVRELYADVRASVWDGPGGALTRALESLPLPKCGGRLLGKLEAWIFPRSGWRLKLLHDHPDPSERSLAVRDPRALFRASFWDAAATGLAMMVAFQSVAFLFSALLFGTGLTMMSYAFAALIYAPLAAGLIGVCAWRNALAARVDGGDASRGLSLLALGLGVGSCVGLRLSFQAAATSELFPSTSFSPGMFFGYQALWLALLLIGFFFVGRWMLAVAQVWLEVNVKRSVISVAFAVNLVVAGFLLVVWLQYLFRLDGLVGYFLDGIPQGDAERFLVASDELAKLYNTSPLPRTDGAALVFAAAFMLVLWPLSVISQPTTLLLLISLWALPFAAWFWRDQSASLTVQDWAVLDAPTSERRDSLEQLPPFHLRTLWWASVIGSITFCLLVIALRLWARGTFSEEVRGTNQFKTVLYYGMVILAALIQAVVAGYVTARVKRLSVLHGLFGAFIAGCLMAAATLAVNLMFGGGAEPSFAWMTFTFVVNSGGLLALFVASVTKLTTGWIRGRHFGLASPANFQQPQPKSNKVMWIILVTVIGVTVIMMGSCAAGVAYLARQHSANTYPALDPQTILCQVEINNSCHVSRHRGQFYSWVDVS